MGMGGASILNSIQSSRIHWMGRWDVEANRG